MFMLFFYPWTAKNIQTVKRRAESAAAPSWRINVWSLMDEGRRRKKKQSEKKLSSFRQCICSVPRNIYSLKCKHTHTHTWTSKPNYGQQFHTWVWACVAVSLYWVQFTPTGTWSTTNMKHFTPCRCKSHSTSGFVRQSEWVKTSPRKIKILT